MVTDFCDFLLLGFACVLLVFVVELDFECCLRVMFVLVFA